MDLTIDYDTLKTVIDRASFRYGAQFEYDKAIFTVFMHRCTKTDEEQGTDPFFWKAESRIGDYDIYIASNVGRKEFRRPILLHETLEACLFTISEGIDDEIELRRAHEIATQYDERYARERLSEELFREYLAFKQGLHGFAGGYGR